MVVVVIRFAILVRVRRIETEQVIFQRVPVRRPFSGIGGHVWKAVAIAIIR
jgi:hypothetical protein